MNLTSSPQEYWDACLIKAWRMDKKISDATCMFRAITSKEHFEYEPKLKRTPHYGIPCTMRMRVFIASFLPKISERLWDQSPEKDVELLRKLVTSDYNTLKNQIPEDVELKKARMQVRANNKRNNLIYQKTMNRNHDTDWSVTKGPIRKSKRK